MKKTFKTIISFLTVAVIILSLSSCSIFESMRNAANNKPEIFDTPDEAQIVAEFNKLLDNSIATAEKINESVSYSAGRPDVLNAEGEEAGLLDTAANQLKTFIMSNNPGSKSEEVADTSATLLKAIDADNVINFEFNRNISSENVTDEKGKEETETVVNENGEVSEVIVTRQFISDNTLHLTFNYFENLPVSEVTTAVAEETTIEEDIYTEDDIYAEEYVEEVVEEVAEEVTEEATEEVTEEATEEVTEEATEEAAEETTEEETTVIYADDSVIEAVFGSAKNKEDVLKNFECIADYIVVKDYTTENEICKITADADLEKGNVSFIRFEQNMKVTVKAQGVGELADYGDIEIVFNLTKTTNYDFTYPTAEEAEDTTSKEADTDTTADEIVIDETTEEITEELIEESTEALTDEVIAEETAETEIEAE